MQKDDIITLPNEHLRERSKKVGIVNDAVKKLIQDMEQATIDWEDSREHEVGVALAAIQVDQPLRIVIIRNDFNNKKDRSFTAFINPKITKYEGELVEDYEGCLSVPDVYGRVRRHDRVRIVAQDLTGREVRFKADGFLARVFQHEIDHTNGIVFVDHIKNDAEAFFKLNTKGNLEELDYAKDIKPSRILW